MPEISDETYQSSENSSDSPESTEQPAEIPVPLSISCCPSYEPGLCVGRFCMCARSMQNKRDSSLCLTWWCVGPFAEYTLGSGSNYYSRSVAGWCYPLWLLISILLIVVEVVVRIVCLTFGAILVVVGIVFMCIITCLIGGLVVAFILLMWAGFLPLFLLLAFVHRQMTREPVGDA